MTLIKQFIDRVSAMEKRANFGNNRDFVMPKEEAIMLRDEIAKLLIDALEQKSNQRDDSLEIHLNGGRW
jgi:hypothetical protein